MKADSLNSSNLPEVQKRRKRRSQAADVWRRFRKNKGAVVGMVVVAFVVFMALFADVIFDFDTQIAAIHPSERLQWPSWQHPFGTDQMGRDIFARVLYGTKFSFSIGIASVLFSALIGIPIGAAAGYFGGAFDDIVMRFMDIFTAIPQILMGIMIVSVLGANTLNLIIAISITSIPAIARITRASVMTVKNQEYIEAARSIGLRESSIIFGHVIPNCLSPIIVRLTLQVASAVVSASSLSFLGLGIAPPSPEWGALLSAGRKFVREQSYMTLFPGLAIMITVLAFNMLGDGLRDSLDPKLRK